MDLRYLRPLARGLIDWTPNANWQWQGFGMLRLYPHPEDRSVRLNVWMPSLATPGVSHVHDHPWDFESIVLAGQLRNFRYCEEHNQHGAWWAWRHIQTGPGGGPKGSPKLCKLRPFVPDVYVRGDSYKQFADEIHRTAALEGTVTINFRRVPPGRDPEDARVFWDIDKDWVSAEPRPATEGEIEAMRAAVAKRWGEP